MDFCRANRSRVLTKLKMCRHFSVIVFLLLLANCLVCSVSAFNVETTHFAKHTGQPQSMFGFSVATHREHGQSWVIVGAPTGQEADNRVHRRGIVYKCDALSEAPCDEIHFHQDQSERATHLDDKNNQWFGATVSSSGPDGPIVACAPRYVWFTTSKEVRRDPVGTCYIAKDNFNTFSEYSPCRTSLFGYHRQGSCQAGFSAGISKDGKRLFVGAPGSWYWQGQMYSINPSVKFPFTPGIFGEAFGFGTKGQIIQHDLDDRPSVTSTPEGPATDDDSYMGYSMVVGDFNGAGVQGIAVGMPKGGKNLEGKVLLYTWSLTNYLNITGKQMGEYYGYSLGTSDIDGDGRDDLIIGAPLHTEKNKDFKYEVGRVYLAYQGRNGSYSHRRFMEGFNSRSRFGLSVAGLGDMNLDGFGDFAVGAPYDGPNENGAIYIYQGSRDGIITHYTQVIHAEDVQLSFGQYSPLSTFGFSITGGLDLDGNDYPDMAVGAYLTDTAFFFRARPVVKVETRLTFESDHIYLERNECQKPGDPKILVPCTKLRLCMRYTGIGTPSQVVMNVMFTFDTKLKSPRMYFAWDQRRVVNTTLTLDKDSPLNCKLTNFVYLKEQIHDKLTELEVNVQYELLNETYYHYTQRDPRSVLRPIVDLSNPAMVNQTISIYRNCGGNNICIPNLYLTVTKQVEKYLYQVGKSLKFEVTITNSGDNSYNTQFFIHLPEGITFNVANEIKGKTMRTIACTKTFNETIYVCDIGNPLPNATSMSIIVEVEPLKVQKILKPTYDFFMNVTSANPGDPKNLPNTYRHISVDVWVYAKLGLEAKSFPPTVYYNSTHYKTESSSEQDLYDNHMRPLVTHSYTVTNLGPSDVEEVELFLVWPLTTLDGQDLLYILEPPQTLGGVKCDMQDIVVNRLKLPTWQLKNIWTTVGITPEAYTNTSQGGFTVENGTVVPPEIGDTITQTISTVTFYNINNAPINQITVVGEPSRDEFWGNISAIASEYREPLTIQTNSSTIITKYIGTVKISEKIVPLMLAEGENANQTYQIIPNITTEVSYYGPAKNLLFQETLHEQPGSLPFKSRVETTKEMLSKQSQPVSTIVTKTTKKITVKTLAGKVVHKETWIQTGTATSTNPEISRSNTVTYVTYYGPDNKILYNETLTVEPTSPIFWEEVNKYVSRYKVPIRVETQTVKVTTYFLNGKVLRKEDHVVTQPVVEGPITSYIETNTKITIFDSNKKILLQETLTGDDYSEYLNKISNQFKEPLIVLIKTTSIITYKRADGRIVRIGTYVEERTETVTPSQLETHTYRNVTLVRIYDLDKNLLHQENITEPDTSSAYWKRINTLVSNYTQGVMVTKKIETYVTYYINGQPTRTELSHNFIYPESSVVTSTQISTAITIYNAQKNVVYEETVPGKANEDHLKIIIERFTEPIVLKVVTTYTIKYSTLQGVLVQTGIFIHETTQGYNPRPQEVKVISVVTTVTILDDRGTVLHQENITDSSDSTAYWEKINKIISLYNNEAITIQKKTYTIVTYYVNNRIVRTETKEEARTPNSVLTPSIGIEADVTIYNLNRDVLYQETKQGEATSDYLSIILKRFTESVTVAVKTTYIITYRNSDGQTVRIGTYVVERTETYKKNPQETHTTTTITTVTITDLSGTILHQENVTEAPNSKEYWEKITKLIGTYHQTVTVHKKVQTIITYYVNGYVVRTETDDVGPGTSETTLTTETEIRALITVQNSQGNVIYRDTLNRPITQDDINNIASRFSESIVIQMETTYTVKYKNEHGQVVQTGIHIERRTESRTRPVVTETSNIVVVTTVVFYDRNRNVLHQEQITDEPGSEAYWNKINAIVNRFRETVTVYITTHSIKTYYINNQPVRTEDIPSGTQPTSYTTNTQTITTVSVFNAQGGYLYQEDIAGEKGTTAYNTKINNILRRYSRELIVLKIKTTYTISYSNLNGRVVQIGTITKESTENHEPIAKETTRSSVTTVITYYGPNRQVLFTENIQDEPGSVGYWEHVKNAILKFKVPATVQTNITNTITYYLNGKEVRTEHIAGNAGIYETPYSAHIDIKNVVSYYDANKNLLWQENVDGEITPQVRQDKIAAFSERYSRTFTVETNTTRTITFKSFNGQILHSTNAPISHPVTPTETLSRTITETTFYVYGTDGARLLYTETIRGEPGSATYNEVVAKIIHRFPGPVTIYTNSTKTITYYTREGSVLDEEVHTEPRSSIQRETGGGVSANARTTITFYGPDGHALHTDTIMGAPGPNLQSQLTKIAKDYNGLVRSYSGSPSYSGEDYNSQEIGDYSNGQHARNYDDLTNYVSSPTINRTTYQEVRRTNVHEDDFNRLGLQDISQEGGLGSFARRGHGFRTGGADLGLDARAKNGFDSYETERTYLSGRPVRDHQQHSSARKHRSKREDANEKEIEMLSNCKTSKCVTIHCTTGPMPLRHEVHVVVRARVFMKNLHITQPVNIRSRLLARISSFHEISGSPSDRELFKKDLSTQVVSSEPFIKPQISPPLWVVVVSAVAGTLILLLLIFLLYMCGFFNRNRPSDAPERQPLNRNGHFQHGDEAL